MSTPMAHHRLSAGNPISTLPRKLRKPRRSVALTGHLPWSSVSLRNEAAASVHGSHRPPVYIALLAVAAVLLHAGVAWYFSTHWATTMVKQQLNEIALQFEQPTPPKPKLEPPQPQVKQQPVQPPQATQPAQVLPSIKTATPEPSSTPAAASNEASVAVAPAATTPEAAPAPITAPVGRAGYLSNPPPQYPAMALRQGWQGTVILRVHVQANGKPDVVEVQQSSGRKLLDDEAVRTVKNLWSYTPAMQGALPIDAWTTTPIEFQIAS